MLDFGTAELFMIFALAVVFAGPEDIPKIMRTIGQGVRRLQYIRYTFSQQFEDFMRDQDLNTLRDEVQQAAQTERKAGFDEADADEEDTGVSDADIKHKAP